MLGDVALLVDVPIVACDQYEKGKEKQREKTDCCWKDKKIWEEIYPCRVSMHACKTHQAVPTAQIKSHKSLPHL